jgi:DNA-binding transcriptional regulator YiaG
MTIWTPETIRALRKSAGLTLDGFANALGVGKRTVRYWSYGRKQPGNMARQKLDAMSRKSAKDNRSKP